jgi:hypothetical protein
MTTQTLPPQADDSFDVPSKVFDFILFGFTVLIIFTLALIAGAIGFAGIHSFFTQRTKRYKYYLFLSICVAMLSLMVFAANYHISLFLGLAYFVALVIILTKLLYFSSVFVKNKIPNHIKYQQREADVFSCD